MIALLVAGAYFVLHINSKTTVENPPVVTEEPAKTNLIIDKSLAEEKTYKGPDQYTTFKVTYPQFKNTSSEFNQKIEDQINAGIAQQKKDSADNWKARYDTQSKGENIPQYPKEDDKFYFNVSWKPVQENNSFVSFILTVSAFEGGAHGYETLTSYNYDVANKKEVTLASLFPNGVNYLKTISDFARKDLTAQFKKRLDVKTKTDEKNFQDGVVPMLMEGTTPVAENFSVFTFTKENVTIYFNQYQVAPYSMGQSSITIQRSPKAPNLIDP